MCREKCWRVVYVRTEDQHADLVAKSLESRSFISMPKQSSM